MEISKKTLAGSSNNASHFPLSSVQRWQDTRDRESDSLILATEPGGLEDRNDASNKIGLNGPSVGCIHWELTVKSVWTD